LVGGAIAATWAGTIVGAAVGGPYAATILLVGTVLSILFALALMIGKQSCARRRTVNDYVARLATMCDALGQRAQRIEAQHRQRESGFQRANGDVLSEIENYRTADQNLQTVIVRYRESQRADFLRGFLIRDYYRQISGLTPSQVIMLEAYSVESANDVERIKLYGIPSIDPETVMELLQWRTEVERQFNFRPEHGITLADVGQAKEIAVRRFKISQARKILTAAKQLESLADAAGDDLKRALVIFNREAESWSKLAREFRDYQSGRRWFERNINRSAAFIAGLAAGLPFIAAVVYVIFH
jgi:DNA-binding helix-hairpin-helix protein with protein kinase domain